MVVTLGPFSETISSRSCPAEKAFPDPVIITHLIELSSLQVSSFCCKLRAISLLNALYLSGRFSVMNATDSFISKFMEDIFCFKSREVLPRRRKATKEHEGFTSRIFVPARLKPFRLAFASLWQDFGHECFIFSICK